MSSSICVTPAGNSRQRACTVYRNLSAMMLILPGFILIPFYAAQAQFLFENNNAPARAAFKVKTDTGFYRMPDSSLCLMWIRAYNRNGLMTIYHDHWQCGKPYRTYEFEYDTSGNCIGSYISAYDDNFRRLEMRHHFDKQGRLIRRVAVDSVRQPTVEVFRYNASGKLVKIEFITPGKNGKTNSWSRTWHGDSSYSVRAVEDVYSTNGKFKWTVLRTYTYYD